MDTNRALEKAAEEKSKGLAKENPLIVNHKSRHNYGSARRKSDVDLEGILTQEQYEVSKLIGAGHRLQTMETRIRCMDFSTVSGGGSPEEFEAHILDLINAYNEWRAAIKSMPQVLPACQNVFGEGMSFAQAARHSHGLMSDKTVKRYCIIGCEEYIELHRPKRQVVKPEPKPEREFIVTKVIEFIYEDGE